MIPDTSESSFLLTVNHKTRRKILYFFLDNSEKSMKHLQDQKDYFLLFLSPLKKNAIRTKNIELKKVQKI